MSEEPFIYCEGLVKVYKVAELEQVALQGLNITVDKGELVGIVGASGSGKSTLMSILGGLDRPTAGRVLVGGHDLLRMPDRQLNRYRREEVGFVWQQSARNLVPYLNAIQNVMLPMTLAGSAGKNSREHASHLLEIVGLGGRMKHHLPELSGGEQQRVAIAVALANNPILLLADEPTGEVDSGTAEVIYGTFQMLTQELGVTTLIVSHDPGIARHVDRVVAIRDGMLATETRRQVRTEASEHGEGLAEEEEHEYEELVVLDQAGRLHIPQDYLEQYHFRQRARIEATEDGILIRPLEEDVLAATTGAVSTNGSTESPNGSGEDDAAESEPAKRRGFWGRFSRRGRQSNKPGKEPAIESGTEPSAESAKETEEN